MSEETDYKKLYEDSLKQVARLETSLEQSNAECKRRKEERATLKAEIDDMRTKTADYDTVRGELRGIKNREVTKTLYEDDELGLNPKVPVERLLTILGIQAGADDFNPDTLREKLAGMRETDPYLFRDADTNQPVVPVSTQTPAREVPRWASRGVSDVSSHTRSIELTESHLRDPVFMAQYSKAQQKK